MRCWLCLQTRGLIVNLIKHYDKLIDENNDPVYDSEPLKAYMDKWDGQGFINALKLDKTKTVLEIGVGTGRLALKAVVLCNKFFGIDISPKTIEKAKYNLSQYQNVELICADFMTYNFENSFDVIYSSLTFMHIKEKQKCINKVYSILNLQGCFVLSIDKSQNEYIEYENRKIKIYPDNLTDVKRYIANSGLLLQNLIETEFAYIFICLKA